MQDHILIVNLFELVVERRRSFLIFALLATCCLLSVIVLVLISVQLSDSAALFEAVQVAQLVQ